MNKQYSYPLDFSWSTEEISSVLSFLNQVEAAYEGGAQATEILITYKEFKNVVRSKGEERKIDKEFEANSGYSSYRVIQQAQKQQKGVVRLEI
ncbi:TPA: UPF0223 family protein [Streptococcus suis]